MKPTRNLSGHIFLTADTDPVNIAGWPLYAVNILIWLLVVLSFAGCATGGGAKYRALPLVVCSKQNCF